MRQVMASPAMRHAYQITYSVRMVSEIAARYQSVQDGRDMLYVRCMVDAFYVHIRLLAEFLVRPTGRLDFGPRAFTTDWDPPKSGAVDRLKTYWGLASKYVVHFGHARVPENIKDLQVFDVSGAAVRQMARDALEVFEAFVGSVERGSRSPDDFVGDVRTRMLRSETDHCRRLLRDV